ncbi:Pam18 [Carpediemonas membranifera]|uniref:Pam18 n=1 Tax=Carpediemonas membranifera TaxID=201153 RepID=A0A8J6BG66_9EUKA|nr:Pam18 [Carpediemonas membranifera]|eukprot:KAG9396822.1 Pam18 [Carpediemonas membranifera]
MSLLAAASRYPRVAAIATGIAVASASLLTISTVSSVLPAQSISFSVPRSYRGDFYNEMNKGEAALILGVPRSASHKEISTRHKKMLMTNHPDRGGSSLLASKINEAKDVLTGKKAKR